VWLVSAPVMVADLGLNGVYPTLRVWSDGRVEWLCSDGGWHVYQAAGVDLAFERAARLAPLVTAALASGYRMDWLGGVDDGEG
jgi:hypothetical protein